MNKNPQDEMVIALEEMLLMDPSMEADMEKAMKAIFDNEKVPFTVSHLQALVLGLRLANSTYSHDKLGNSAMMAAFALKFIKNKKADLEKIKL